MNEEITNQLKSPAVPTKTTFISKIWAKIPEKLKGKLSAFYANKKVFIPVSIAFGLLFLVLILGLIFGQREPKMAARRPTVPTPVPTSTNVVVPGDELSQIQLRLTKLKDQILGMDINQSRLQPPSIDYDIRF